MSNPQPRTHHSVCPLDCPDRCSLEVRVEGGRVVSIEDKGVRADVVAHAPLAALAGYTTALRSLTQGRASASMVFHAYEEARAG